MERLRKLPIILPTPEFFPEPYEQTTQAGYVLVCRVCHYMGINPDGLHISFYETLRQHGTIGSYTYEGAAGLYESAGWATRISIDTSSLHDPMILVATAAHEVGHVLLLGQGRLSPDEADHEPLTDLLTVALGFGVFTANSRVRSKAGHAGAIEHWSIQRLGYLSQPATGYALALLARIREEDNPSWASHLCTDVYGYFKQARRYLQKTKASLFDTQTGKFAALSDDELPPGYNRI